MHCKLIQECITKRRKRIKANDSSKRMQEKKNEGTQKMENIVNRQQDLRHKFKYF